MNEDILRKVRALLAKAEASGVTADEAEAFSRKAEELIARYAIDQAVLNAKAETKERPELRIIVLESPYHKPKAFLLNGIAIAFDCKLIYTNRRKGRDAFCRIVGFPSDLDAVELLYNSLMLQAMSAMLAANPGYEHGKTFRASFMYGFSNRVYRRLQDMRERAKSDSQSADTSTALVLRDRSIEVELAAEKEFGKSTKVAAAARSKRGREAGDRAGRNADIGHGRVSAGAKNAIGG